MRDILILIGKCILPDDRYGLTGKASKNDETGDLRLPPVGSLVVYLPLFRALEQTEYGSHSFLTNFFAKHIIVRCQESLSL
jgi:hypothetical protein